MVRPYDIYKINGTPLLAPDNGADFSTFDIEDGSTGRDESGYIHRSLIRSDIRKWSFSYSVLTSEEYIYLIDILRASKPTFTFEFQNESGVKCLAECYVNETGVSYFSRRNGLYKNLKFDVIEC